MLSLISLPAKIISIIEGNISPREIALGVCLGAFLGFIPLNGPMALLLAIFFFLFKINRIATLLTLPIFKFAYLLGMYRLADITGTYVLEKADYLASFWRWLTHLPVISYLDINNTLIAGGIIIAAVLSIPIYFIAKLSVGFLSTKYSEKIKNSALAKLIPSVKLMGLVGDDTGSTLKNVNTQVRLSVTTKIREAIVKKKGQGRPDSLLKRIKIANVAIIIILLTVVHFSIGLFVSPALSSFIVASINKYSSAKIAIDKVSIWPLTLSFSLKGMSIFDPDRRDVRIAKIDDSLVKISPIGILSKRLVFSRIHMKGAEINLEGTSDGTFNISHLVSAQKGAPKSEPDLAWRSLMQNKDLFGKTYETIKKRFSKKSKEKIKEDRKNAKSVTAIVQALPKGKLVRFKNTKDLYLFEISSLDISDAYIKVKIDGESVDITDVQMRLGHIAYDPENGAKIALGDLRGTINKSAKPAGKLDIYFSEGVDTNGPKAVLRVELNDVDMDAVRFVYEGSLPVHVAKGFITLRSNTRIESGMIDSRNEISLKGQAIEPKTGGAQAMGFLPISAVCEAMNRIDPLKLKFNITGTVEKPELGGFQESMTALIKPYIANFQETLKNEGLNAIGRLLNKNIDVQGGQEAPAGSDNKSADLEGAVNSLKSLFGNKKE